ncbi:hypothetical protein [Litorimonas sp. WD9-15]|uniref:hypothetical protein n=1 Tax=Litorimonas sp. WD9-15 TaxID=3418716 RepID=UPI003D03A175
MRDFVQKYEKLVLYLIRIPTRFLMMYLGANDSGIVSAIQLTLFSLCLIACVKRAPTTLLRPQILAHENFRTGQTVKPNTVWQRLDWNRLKLTAKHFVSAFAMAAIFYSLGKFLF